VVKIQLIVNPNAGKQRGTEVARRAESALLSAGADVTRSVSTYPGEAVELAARIAGDADAVIAVGGDGTLFEVLNGLAGTGHPFPILGQIPVGTGNSFIRDLGITDADGAVTAILAGHTRPVDIGRFSTGDGGWYFINLLGAGFVSSVAHTAGRYKRWGALSYVIAVVRETIALSTTPVTLTIDGTTVEREGVFVEICNSRYTGGAMMMAPDAAIDDGLLDVVVMSRCTRRKLLALFPRIFSGKHVDDPLIEVFRGRNVAVRTGSPWLLTPDGETFGTTPITAEIIRHGARILAPVEAPPA